MSRVVFLFNHDAPHQVAHLAGAAAAYAELRPRDDTVVAHGGGRIRQAVEGLLPTGAAAKLRWHELSLHPALGLAARLADRLVPASRLARLRTHAGFFASADAIVSTERTCLRLKRHLPAKGMPRFARMPHGAGDRNVTYHPDFKRFDLVMASGSKAEDELMQRGVAPDRIRVVGYPKFDIVDLAAQPVLFADDRPVFVYNPHFDPHLSSWYRHGPALLRWFASAEGQAFNLVFAPHVMLFRKRLHVSPEFRTARWRPDVPAEAFTATNIIVDVEGPRLFDMSYVLGADAYIGDVSSQLYEFLARPRPVFLLGNFPPARALSEGSDLFTRAGPAFPTTAELVRAIPEWRSIGERHRDPQREMFSRTFSVTGEPAAYRAARAVAELVDREPA